ncbi:MAG TPA: bifunctional 2-polyprenyl-6-hydroxyphenol methylase/3-demethylubiquinol 3-O-methyltransferase UbiG, partial [Xanthomonadaceae bacterium]|nr:bifunctional 2-polyprenyl-6-hydroxyphenol methylase/3-demethylubiquinol 3-O-methyltransferase UbiG [Xanthomonadaceae bacterium]
ERQPLSAARVCDIGCGGGLLSEAMAARGAEVVAIDLGEDVLGVAQLHLLESGLEVDYRLSSVEDLAVAEPESFDAVTCMEMLEHVPDPAAVIEACARLLKPGGRLFLSTLNRTPKAFALAVVGAEYVLGLLPRGTHQYARFIRPAELGRWLRMAGLELEDVSGMHYNPLLRRATLKRDVAVNYLACALKPA